MTEFRRLYDQMLKAMIEDFMFEQDLKFREAFYGSAYGPYLHQTVTDGIVRL